MLPRKIGISVISLLPWSIGNGGPLRSLERAKQAGLDGLQLVPLRGWRPEDILALPQQSVLSYEGRWNKNPSFLSLDYALFGSSCSAAIRVSHFSAFARALSVDIDGQSLVEVSPGNPGSLEEKKIVLDTWHLREFRKIEPLKWILGTPKRGQEIHLIHFQTRLKDELVGFLSGERHNPLGEILWALRSIGSQAPVIIELPPQWLLIRTKEKLRRIRERIATVLN